MSQSPDSSAKLREQRDRFVAFAFAGAEALIELDDQRTITYCAGASESLLGGAPEALVGQSLLNLVAPEDQTMLQELIRRIETVGRMDRIRIHFQAAGRQPVAASLSGLCFPGRKETLYLTASRAHGGNPGKTQITAPARTKEEFAQMAEQRMQEAAQFGDELRMTLIDLADSSLNERMDSEAIGTFLQGVESYLRAWSVGGNSIGQIDDTKFGIIHDKSLQVEQMSSRISDIASLFDPSGAGLEVKAVSVELDRSVITEEDLNKALIYTLTSFAENGGKDFTLKSLSQGYQQALDETLTKVTAFREALNSDSFTLVYQPIVDLKAWSVHHYEALARMQQGERLFLPARFIGFAEDFGVVNEFDTMVVKKAIAALRAGKKLHGSAQIAVNLSGKSLSNEAFVHGLFLLLLENRDILPRMMFELTESSELADLESANKILQKIRSFGCKVSIDDFGAGAAAFNYLKALKVDYVKIDGSYILDAFHTTHGKPFLKAIAHLCRDMNIQSIGEMVEDSRTMWLLKEVGVDFGQGYFFGRPLPDITGFSLSPIPKTR
ncbi:EAL domain-containing protein [Insolitispirillum peregrinum]|uniref:PAS domain S-box-containing protein n=1 Tax=Insolitispirillum peregrinum TaxID=80876 RepID=A0A1N7ITE7_9PROT|nr:EAL domain-containing protein [Insolitispirillum peregrinum]SIS40378.1 PAS domain S-box-containing protein [Insolitispirillum peregrinum]